MTAIIEVRSGWCARSDPIVGIGVSPVQSLIFRVGENDAVALNIGWWRTRRTFSAPGSRGAARCGPPEPGADRWCDDDQLDHDLHVCADDGLRQFEIVPGFVGRGRRRVGCRSHRRQGEEEGQSQMQVTRILEVIEPREQAGKSPMPVSVGVGEARTSS